MIILGILYLAFFIGGFLVFCKFVNSGPKSNTNYGNGKYKIIGFIFAVILLGIWGFFSFEFIKAYDKAHEILLNNTETAGSFYSKITNLVIKLFEDGKQIQGARVLLLRESYLKSIISFIGAYISLFIFWKLINPPDEDLDTNTKYRRIGIIFSMVFIITWVFNAIFSTAYNFYYWF